MKRNPNITKTESKNTKFTREVGEVDLFKGGFTHSCFIKLMHHSCQEDFAQFGTTFHYLQKEKTKIIIKAYPKKITTLLSLCKCNINEKSLLSPL